MFSKWNIAVILYFLQSSLAIFVSVPTRGLDPLLFHQIETVNSTIACAGLCRLKEGCNFVSYSEESKVCHMGTLEAFEDLVPPSQTLTPADGTILFDKGKLMYSVFWYD